MAITEFRGEYRWLSNFWTSYINVDHWHFASAEHLYQAGKCANRDDVIRFTTVKPSLPSHAKKLGRQIDIRPDWDLVRLNVMREVIELKFEQNLDLKRKLIATRGIELIEGNTWGDRFWGVCNGVGENHLGRILTVYRDSLPGSA